MKHNFSRLINSRGFPVLLAFPFFKPAVFAELSWAAPLETGFNLWRAAAAVFIFVWYLLHHIQSRKLPSPVMFGLLICESAIVISTLWHTPQNYFYPINCAVTIISFCMLIELIIRRNRLQALDCILGPLTFQLLINFILLLIFPSGILVGGNYGNSFNYMAIDNQLAAFVIPFMTLLPIRSVLVHDRVTMPVYLLCCMGFLTLLLVWSATGMVATLVLLLYILLFFRHRAQVLANYAVFLLCAFGIFFCIVIFRLQNVFSPFFENVLHKGLSFTGRTELWDIARDLFLSSPILGVGLGLQGKVYRFRKHRYYTAHNIFCEILLEGGLIAMGGYLLMLFTAGKQMLAYRRHPFACMISAGMISFALVSSMESYNDINAVGLFALLFFCYHISALIAPSPQPQVTGSPAPVLPEAAAFCPHDRTE